MNKRLIILLFLFLISLPVSATRYKRSINDNWIFHKEGSSVTQVVSVPHTWNAEDATDDEPGYWRGAGWYEKTIQINDNLNGIKVYVRFEGANQEVDLWVNGNHAGNHKGGYTAFIFDVSDLIQNGANEFRVKVDNSHNEGIPPMTADYTFFGGIYRDVELLFVPENHISVEHYASDGVYINTPEVSAEKASVKIETRLSITHPEKQLYLDQTIFDPDGKEVARIRRKLVMSSGDLVVNTEANVPKPLLWDLDTPQLYSVITRLLDKKGKEIDSQRNSFGIRYFHFDPDKGFSLNGRHVKLFGTNRHQDFPGKGNALPDEMHVRDVRLLKDMGGNFLRISHYPQDQLISECCDSMGILSCMEIPVVDRIGYADDFTVNCENMAREMVYQYYNHPSIVLWAYMNEVLQDKSQWGSGAMPKEEYFAKVKACAYAIDLAIRQADPSRPTMIPCDAEVNKYRECGICDIPDIVGFNLYYGWYYGKLTKLGSGLDNIHAMFPDKPLFVTEYGADADSRLHSFQPERMDYTGDYALLFHKSYIPVLMQKDYVSGATVWNLNDFHSESRGFAVPHFNLKGLVTSERTPKDGYWLYKALFSQGPFIRIGGGDWKIRGGQADGITCKQFVEVYATAPEVELLLNGKSLGVKPVSGGWTSFEVPFIDGDNVLEARGSDGVADFQDVDFRLIPEDMSRFREICVMLGSKRYFEDREGSRVWIPEQEYRSGSWGFVGGEASDIATSGVADTDLDPVFQTSRTGLEAFKADVPDGMYCVSLYFAEFEETDREFSVLINGKAVLQNFSIVRERGINTALMKDFAVEVDGGNGISVEFIPLKGRPVLNAISIERNIVSVKAFGAKGDGVTLDTDAIQAAIDHMAQLGGGAVSVPEGTYLCGSIWLRSNINLSLEADAVIKGSPDINDYCAADCCPQNEGEAGWGDYMSGGHLLLGVGVQNVKLSGPGKIDGNSDAFLLDADGKPFKKKSEIPARPGQMVWFVDSRDITITDMELADSPYWSCFILNCEDVSIDGCYVHTRRKDYHTFNGDGIDIDRCLNVSVSNCRVDTADDCITLRASSAHLLENPQDCARVTVSGCSLSSSCNAIRVGVGEGHIHDAVLSDITISDTKTAFNIVASYSKGSRGTDIDGIVFKDIRVEANELMRIHHMRSKDAIIKDISFENISGTAPDDSHIWAKRSAPFRNIVLRNVNVPARFECVDACVKVKGGLIKKRKLSSKDMKQRRENIENEKKLLY